MSIRHAPLAVLLVVACRPPVPPAGPGSLSGLVRSASTGVGVPGTRIVLRRPGSIAPVQSVTDPDGAYLIADLPPGRYEVSAYAAEAKIADREIVVTAGRITGLDFALGASGTGAPLDLTAPPWAPLWRYRPPGADPSHGAIEGTIADVQRLDRLAGAVVSVVRDGGTQAEIVITDDVGRFRVGPLTPGTYTVSAFYEVLRIGQIEVLRNNVQVAGGEVVVVPLWLSTDGF